MLKISNSLCRQSTSDRLSLSIHCHHDYFRLVRRQAGREGSSHFVEARLGMSKERPNFPALLFKGGRDSMQAAVADQPWRY